jgi:chromosome segregation ATPase
MENNTDFARLNERVAVLENQSVQLSLLLTKLETTIDRLADVSGSLKEFIAIHDHRLEQAEKREVALNESLEFRRRESDFHIDNIEKNIVRMDSELKAHQEREETALRTIDADVKSLTRRVNTLEKWRWIIVGSVTILYVLFEIFLKT